MKICILKYFVITVLVLIVFIPLILFINKAYFVFPISNKATIEDSKVLLDYPWGKVANLTVFADLDNVSLKVGNDFCLICQKNCFIF